MTEDCFHCDNTKLLPMVNVAGIKKRVDCPLMMKNGDYCCGAECLSNNCVIGLRFNMKCIENKIEKLLKKKLTFKDVYNNGIITMRAGYETRDTFFSAYAECEKCITMLLADKEEEFLRHITSDETMNKWKDAVELKDIE